MSDGITKKTLSQDPQIICPICHSTGKGKDAMKEGDVFVAYGLLWVVEEVLRCGRCGGKGWIYET